MYSFYLISFCITSSFYTYIRTKKSRENDNIGSRLDFCYTYIHISVLSFLGEKDTTYSWNFWNGYKYGNEGYGDCKVERRQ